MAAIAQEQNGREERFQIMRILTIITLLLVAVAMGFALAHLLEMPGKLRLDEAAYRTVQTIYYPGFPIGGIVGEVGGLLALVGLLYLTPYGGARFWWTCAALVLLAAVHGTFWLVTQPINSLWAGGDTMSPIVAALFDLLAGENAPAWQHMRNVWEISHAIRAVLATFSLAALAMATSHFEGWNPGGLSRYRPNRLERP